MATYYNKTNIVECPPMIPLNRRAVLPPLDCRLRPTARATVQFERRAFPHSLRAVQIRPELNAARVEHAFHFDLFCVAKVSRFDRLFSSHQNLLNYRKNVLCSTIR